METVRSVESDLGYFKKLVGAGWEGIRSTRHELDAGVLSSPLQTGGWRPAAIGATFGMLSIRMIGKRKSASRVAMGGLVGGVLGFGAAKAWPFRRMVGPAAGAAIRRVNAARDAHWLETNPIDYA